MGQKLEDSLKGAMGILERELKWHRGHPGIIPEENEAWFIKGCEHCVEVLRQAAGIEEKYEAIMVARSPGKVCV